MNYHRIFKNDMVNGEGVRTTLFVSGCEHQCRGCYNQSTWNPDSGEPFTDETIQEILESLASNFVDGLSLSGGDPLHPRNLGCIIQLVRKVREVYGRNKTIWLWTGYTLDEILNSEKKEILDLIDVLIDGKFEQELYDPKLIFRGSSNQRLIKIDEIH